MNEQLDMNMLMSQPEEMENYLDRVGQINNNMMTLRDMAAREAIEMDWLDDLGIGAEDLVKDPEPLPLLKLLYSRNIQVKTAINVQDYREVVEEYEAYCLENEETPISELEMSDFTTAGPAGDAQLLALPELELKLTNWATTHLNTYGLMTTPLTFPQVIILAHHTMFVEQEPEMNLVWAVESLQSLLSSDFYKSAGNQP